MTKYTLMVLGGAVSFGILTSFVKLAYNRGFNAAEISFIQASLGAIVLWIIVCFSKKKRVKRIELPKLLFTGAAIGISTFLYYLSVKYIPASIAIVILMQFTWLSLLMEWIIFKKRPAVLEVTITLIILLGTMFASGLATHQGLTLSILGVIYVSAASLIYAIYIVANSRFGKQISWQNKSAWIMTGSTISILLANFNTLVSNNHFGMELLGWGLFLAFFGTILPPILFAIGMPKIGAPTSGLLMTVELPIAILAAHLILGENISTKQLAGITVMLLAIIWMNFVKQNKLKNNLHNSSSS
jgi:drug/metabolite transporter (DMT)-like permease